MNVLITGADGFVGTALCAKLQDSGCSIFKVVRTATASDQISVGNITECTQWDDALNQKIDVVVHLAAVTSLFNSTGTPEDIEACYRRVNVLGAINFAKQCADNNVRRFIFISTVKVLGEGDVAQYHWDDPALPSDFYATTKWEAERSLRTIANNSKMELCIIRPPLVYGPGVKANFLRLIKAIDNRWPLPLGAIHNRRSLIYLGNLVDAISLCLTHPKAAGKTFMVSDNDDVSTPELVRRLAKAFDTPPFLLPIPVSWIRFVGGLLGKAASVDRLVGSFAVDIAPIQKELGWTPPYSMEAGLSATAEWYRRSELSQ
jgi:nucleoside-diphosphate-sugar epimerase